MAGKPGQFRAVISDEHPTFKPEENRYILYVAQQCPFAHRVLIARALKKLGEIVPIVTVDSIFDPTTSWRFKPELGEDPIIGAKYLRELYQLDQPGYDGRVTVPMLFDKKTRKIVNNESAEIVRMFNTAFNSLLLPKNAGINLRPDSLVHEIDNNLMPWLLRDITFCVYKISSAKTQEDYETNCKIMFSALDRFEVTLRQQPFLAGDVLTEADVLIYPWIVRFAPLYECLYKCNLKSLRDDSDYPNIMKWLRRIYQIPGIADTMDFKQIVEGSYMSQVVHNPSKLVPLYRGPDLSTPKADIKEENFAKF